MNKELIVVIGISALLIILAVTVVSYADSDGTEIHTGTIRIKDQSESGFPSMAKISMVQAVQKALRVIQGDVLKLELKDENGFLVYGVKIVTTDKTVMEVKVDAGSGEVLAIHRDEDRESVGLNDRDHED